MRGGGGGGGGGDDVDDDTQHDVGNCVSTTTSASDDDDDDFDDDDGENDFDDVATKTKTRRRRRIIVESSSSSSSFTSSPRRRRKQKRREKKALRKRLDTRVAKMEGHATAARAISGFASGSIKLLPNKNGKKPISTTTNVQWAMVALFALGAAQKLAAERAAAAARPPTKQKTKTKEKEEDFGGEDPKMEKRRKTRTMKRAAMMTTFLCKPVTVTGALVLREVCRSALALLGERNESLAGTTHLGLMTPPLTPRRSRQSTNESESKDDKEEEEDDEVEETSDASSENTTKTKRCSNCGVKISNVLRCARCRQTCYCSQECQKNEWNEHKKTCVPSLELLETTRRANEKVREATVNWDGTFQASTILFEAVKRLTNFAKRCGDAKSSGDALWVSLILFANEIDMYGEIKRKDGWRDVSFDQHLETCEEAARIVMRSEFLYGANSGNKDDDDGDDEETKKSKKARARALARLALGTCALRGAKRSTKIALENFYDAREDAVRCKCPFLAAEACRRICFAHLSTGNFSSASIAIQQAIEFAKLVAEKKKKNENENETMMYYCYRLFHADIHESLEVCVLLEHLKVSREYFGKNNTTPREPSERAYFLAKDKSYHEKKKASNLETIAIGEALLKREELSLRNGDDDKSARVRQTIYAILAETYYELNEKKKCEDLVQKIDEGGGCGFKCAYCDERVILGELKEQEEGQDAPILPWQMEYRTCLNPRVPHIFHTKCVRGLKAPHRKKHEVCVCCQQCVKEKNFDS